jgi:hypothetical protein
MLTIEKALALTPAGFKLTSFDSKNNSAVWTDRNGNTVTKFSNGYFGVYNGKMSQNYDNIDEATAFVTTNKTWWK